MKEKLSLSFLILLVLFSGCVSFPSQEPPESVSPAAPSESSRPEASSESGPGEEEPPAPPVITTEIEGIKAAEIKEFTCEASTPAVILKNGDVVLWGGNVFYEVGNGGGGSGHVEPAPLTLHHFPSPIVQVCSNVVSYAVAENGDLYGWGRNSFQQLGCETEYFSSPQKIDFGFRVKQAVSSGIFSLFLSQEGQVYGTGLDVTTCRSLQEFQNNTSGYPLKEPETGLRMLALPFKCKLIALAGIAQVFLSEEGEVYYQGLLLGDCSYSSPDFYSEAPQKINFPEKIIDIAATDFNVIALSESGKVYVYGHPLSGVSDSQTDTRLEEDLFCKSLKDIVSISSGEFSVMAVSREGRVYCWGLDMSGVIDPKNDTGEPPSSYELIPEPRDMGYSGVVSGMIGERNGTVLCEDGTAHIWGRNTMGQIIEFQ